MNVERCSYFCKTIFAWLLVRFCESIILASDSLEVELAAVKGLVDKARRARDLKHGGRIG